MPDMDLINYRKWVDSLVEVSEKDEYWYKVYQTMCVKNRTNNCLPYGLTRVEAVSHPIFIEVAGWGKLSGPTAISVIKKIVKAHEEAKKKKWEQKLGEKRKF